VNFASAMKNRARIRCACGGELRRPLAVHCPHCREQISGVRRPLWSLVWPLLAIMLMFAAIIAYLWWLLGGAE